MTDTQTPDEERELTAAQIVDRALGNAASAPRQLTPDDHDSLSAAEIIARATGH